jgi:chemotaxis protein methyltransferase CheR
MTGGVLLRAIASSGPNTIPASITDRMFTLYQTLIRQEAGIYLAPTKKSLVVGRLGRRLRELGLSSFEEYYKLVTEGGNAEEKIRMLDHICTNETSFFRDHHPFDFIKQSVLPTLECQANNGERSREIRLWSCGCSTGEEPYSLAMLLLDHFPPSSGWTLDILATDLSTRALAHAEAGIWPLEKAKTIPPEYLKRFMLRGNGSQTGQMKAGNEIRKLVRFERVNLNEHSLSVLGTFDLILFRNVMIYFDMETKKRIVERLVDRLNPSGHIVVGLAESPNGLTDRVNRVAPGVYLRKDR